MSIVAAVSLVYQAGKDVSESWLVTRDDEDVDLSGMTIRAAIAREIGSDPVLSSADETITLTAANQTTNTGEFAWGWTQEASEDLSGTYRFEIEVEDALGAKETVARGFVTFKDNML